MNNYAIIFYVIISFSVFGQNRKPLFYFDVNDSRITKSVFLEKYNDRKDDISYLSLTFKNDTCFIHKLVKRKNYGRLKVDEHKSLIAHLNYKYQKQNSDYTIIQYYPGYDICNGGNFKGNAYEKRYLKKLKKNINLNNYWVHKKDTIDFRRRGRVKWQLDKDEYVEKLFFKYHYPCNSFVVIDNKSKNFISIFGEYGDFTVVEIVEEISIKH